VWAMESLVNGHEVNQIRVDPEIAKFSRVALERMLSLP
jgi:quinolinate synthase